jgi:hypothetical protein
MGRIDLNKMDAMTDADIDYNDIPELPDDFVEQAEWFSEAGKHRGGRQNSVMLCWKFASPSLTTF